MKTLRFILRNLDYYRGRFLFIIVVQFLGGTFGFLIPVLLAEFTKQHFTPSRLSQLIAGIVAVYAASLGLSWIVRYLGEAQAFQFGNHIREKYFLRIEHLPAERLHKQHSGYVLSLINKISDGLDILVYEIFYTFAGGLAVVLLFFYFTARESVVLAFANLGLLVTFVVTSTLLARRMVPLADEQNRRRSSLLESYADFMANIMTIKKLGIHRFAEGRIGAKTQALAQQISHVQRFHADRWFILHGLYGIAYLATIVFLLHGVSAGTVSASILILFVGAYVLIQGLTAKLSEDIKAYMEMNAYIASLEEIIGDEILQAPGRLKKQWRTISLQDVTFRYKGAAAAEAVTVPSLTLHKGEKIALVGKSGQGKSTVLNLLTNHLAPQSGRRLVDDTAYEELDTAFFSTHVATISQEVDLFNLSVRENLTLGQPVQDAVIIRCLREVDLGQWLTGLDKELDTVVGEKGLTLSAGQKQRLNIVRGILLNRDIYILDEPTAHLDSATEKLVAAFLANHLQGKTAVIVTHRPLLIGLCGKTYEMKNYRLAASASAG